MKTATTSGKRISKVNDETVPEFYKKGLGSVSLNAPLKAKLHEPLYK